MEISNSNSKEPMQNIGKVAKSSIAIMIVIKYDSTTRTIEKENNNIQQTLVMAQQDTKLFSPSNVGNESQIRKVRKSIRRHN